MTIKKDHHSLLRKLSQGLLLGVLLVFILLGRRASQAQALQPDDWGTPIPPPSFHTNYTIYTQNFSYAEPFRITDMRSSDNNPIESYDMHTLDIYRPVEDGVLLENRPVVFFVHGGGWTEGYRRWFRSLSWSFTGQLGWITVVVDYRLTGYDVFIADQYCPDRATCGLPENANLRSKAAEYPDNIQDVASALRWTRDWIGEQGGNPTAIFGLGYSAGAHLIALLATHPDYADLRSDLRAIAALSGPYNLVSEDFKGDYLFVLAPTFGVPLDNIELADASPQSQISGVNWLPPIQLLHAEHDLPYLNDQTIQLAQSIHDKSLTVEIVYLQGYSHDSEMSALQFVDKYPTRQIIHFFESYLSSVIYLPLIQR